MIEKIYAENLKTAMPELDRLAFADAVQYCRELLGMKQYTCAEYLGFEYSRFKKLELGRFSEPIEAWEMMRLQTFFQLPEGYLQDKQKSYLLKGPTDRMETGKAVWNSDESTAGERQKRDGDYKRIRGTM